VVTNINGQHKNDQVVDTVTNDEIHEFSCCVSSWCGYELI